MQAETELERTKGSASELKRLLGRLVDWIAPMCPRGGHRQQGAMVTNIKGNSFCWHRDCMKANFDDVRDT